MKLRSLSTLASLVFAFSFTLASADADARRFGGGKSSGMQRQSSVTPGRTAAPEQAATPARTQTPAANAPQAQPRRSWMGPLAGLAAGLGLAALASHLGLGGELGSIVMLGLLIVAAMMVIGYLRRRHAPLPAPAGNGSRFAMAGGGYGNAPIASVERRLPPAASTGTGSLPADFDLAGFLRAAKLTFIRLQAANDAGNLDDIREFTSPEMFAEIRLSLAERGNAKQVTDVIGVDAEVLEVTDAPGRIASVRFTGLVREEEGAQAQAVDEIWHMTQEINGGRHWVVAGIQQTQ